MRLTNDTLECAVVVARTLGDDIRVWRDFLDERMTRVRDFVIQSLQLTREESTLHIEQARLRRLVQEHHVWSQSIQHVIHDRPSQDWNALGECWHRLCRVHYRPWTREQCHDEIHSALKQINAFQWSTDKQSSGLTIDGWREVRRVDPVQRVLQYEFCKTFRGYDVMDYVNVLWDAFTDADSFQTVVGGHRMLLQLDVLEQIGPHMVIVQLYERHPGIIGDVHGVYLVFRRRTERGFMQFVRSVWSPEVLVAIQGPHDMVAHSNCLWYHWDVQEEAVREFTFRNGGALGGVDMSYANRWMAEVFAAVVRIEQKATGHSLLKPDT